MFLSLSSFFTGESHLSCIIWYRRTHRLSKWWDCADQTISPVATTRFKWASAPQPQSASVRGAYAIMNSWWCNHDQGWGYWKAKDKLPISPTIPRNLDMWWGASQSLNTMNNVLKIIMCLHILWRPVVRQETERLKSLLSQNAWSALFPVSHSLNFQSNQQIEAGRSQWIL